LQPVKYVLDTEIGWRDVWLSGLITAALFPLGKTAMGLYLGQTSVGSAYGVTPQSHAISGAAPQT